MATDVKKKIGEKLVELSSRMDIEKINVTMLIRECGISRTLFYYYYQDLFAVIEDLLSSEMEKVMNDCAAIDDPYESVKYYMYCIFGKFPILRRVRGSKYYENAERLIIETNRKYLEIVFRKKAGSVEISPGYSDFLMDFMSAGITAYFFRHCTDSAFDTEKAAGYLYRIIAREIGLPENRPGESRNY